MNLTRIKATFAAGVLACSMILPNVTAFAAVTPINSTNGKIVEGITKVIESPDGVTYGGENGDSFVFSFSQRSQETDSGVTANVKTGTIANTTISGVKSSTTASDTNKQDDTTKVWTQTLKGDIDLSGITDTGVYTFDIKELKSTDANGSTIQTGETWTWDETGYVLRVYVTKDANNNLTKKATIVDTANKDNDGKKVPSASFTNKVTKEATFSLTKALGEDDQAYEPLNQTYTFTVEFAVQEPNKLKDSYSYTVGSETRTWSSSNKTVTIKNGEYAIFEGLPAGTVITITETGLQTNMSGVTATYQNGKDENATALTLTDGGATIGTTAVNTKGQVTLNDQGTVVTYTNDWKDVTVTGVVTDIAPYITLVVVAVAGIAAYVGFKKRIAR